VAVTQAFDKAVFTDARAVDARAKWALLLFLLLLLTVVYWALRDIVYERLVYGFAQRTFNELAGASLERIGEVEVDRQGDLVFRRVEAWTLDWDDEAGALRKMRSKETEADYRYFREPDLLSVQLDAAWRAAILAQLPELPLARRARFVADYALSDYDAGVLTDERSLSDYFEETVRQLAPLQPALSPQSPAPKSVANWLMNDLLRLLNDRGLTAREVAATLTPARLAELIHLVEARTINRATGVSLIPKIIETDRAPRAIVEAEGLGQISGDDALRALAREVLAENPEQIEQYRKKPTLLKWFVGQVMKKSRGQADAQAAERVLSELLGQS